MILRYFLWTGAEFDAINGGFATQELVLLGGRRGSGKSIISLNMALNRFLEGNTVAFFTIEMRYKEVYDRVLSIISEVPFLIYLETKQRLNKKFKWLKLNLNIFINLQIKLMLY